MREGASVEEIKKAYRELVKKYHPDQYKDNPLSDLAEAKLKEINEAYEYLMKNRGNSESGGYSNGRSQWGNSGRTGWESGSNSADAFRQVRIHIDRGDLETAENLLGRISLRTAEWYFLKGLVFLRRGWYDEARYHIQTAVNMDPGNYEYRETLNRIRSSGQDYMRRAYDRGYRNDVDDFCTLCQCLICSDCCCECLGGDLITCC